MDRNHCTNPLGRLLSLNEKCSLVLLVAIGLFLVQNPDVKFFLFLLACFYTVLYVEKLRHPVAPPSDSRRAATSPVIDFSI